MLIKLSSNKTVTAAAASLQAAVEANHFGVMQVHNLKETMNKKGVEFARECLTSAARWKHVLNITIQLPSLPMPAAPMKPSMTLPRS